MTIHLAPSLDLHLDEEVYVPAAFTAEPAAALAADVLVDEGRHVHLVGGDVQCLTHSCVALPGA
ncbi:hypothetical protein ACTVZO_17635 [Streptomyces sp. IBSNAI002]|uniref:hypothetical protein n=1 Tax=Streptomyces sp. IBSNAI002 TaxID=3457500 RepID=UPI003FD404A9